VSVPSTVPADLPDHRVPDGNPDEPAMPPSRSGRSASRAGGPEEFEGIDLPERAHAACGASPDLP
jgi:hypothetical protein